MKLDLAALGFTFITLKYAAIDLAFDNSDDSDNWASVNLRTKYDMMTELEEDMKHALTWS